jgi:hypothetical protein
MEPTQDRRRRRLLISLIAGGLVLLALVGVGVYGLVRGPATDTATTATPTSGSAPTAPTTPTARATPTPIITLGSPEDFTRNLATALFAWDTSTGLMPVDYLQPLADVAANAEADAFVSDVRSYLPSDQAWAQLRGYQTRQWLTIDTVVVPDAWDTALAQAAPGQIPPGTTAFTIDGVRHRAGIWGTTPTDAEHSVSFTVFVTCAPPVPEHPKVQSCRVLRLSALDKPLR